MENEAFQRKIMVSLAATSELEREDRRDSSRLGAAQRFVKPAPGKPGRLAMTDREEGAATPPFHRPVLLSEVKGRLGVRPGGLYVDATVGDGGHALSFLRASAPQGSVLGIDRDPRSLVRAAERLAPFGDRFIPALGSYADMTALARKVWGNSARVDGVLLDLGISSLQVDAAGFGFSFQRDEPLDMRFDPNSNLPPAAEIINTWPEEELARILWEYGEEPRSRAIARALVRRRPVDTTAELANLVGEVAGRNPKGRTRGRTGGRRRTHPATRTFQALRIAVNDELATLTAGLQATTELLAPAGRLAVISYHSLEDRSVKTFLSRQSAQCLCPPALPVCLCQHQPTLRRVNRRVIRPEAEEVAANPRSRSARLRVAERLAE